MLLATEIYDTLDWLLARADALERDEGRCTAVEWYDVQVDEWGDLYEVPVRCSETSDLHVHHIERPDDGGDPYDLENLLTLCNVHHGKLHGMMRARERERSQDEDLSSVLQAEAAKAVRRGREEEGWPLLPLQDV